MMMYVVKARRLDAYRGYMFDGDCIDRMCYTIKLVCRMLTVLAACALPHL